MEIDMIKKLNDFTTQMLIIINEKAKENPNNLWKSCELDFLLKKLYTQLGSINLKNYKHSERIKRKLIHITNYCFFLYTRINELKVDK